MVPQAGALLLTQMLQVTSLRRRLSEGLGQQPVDLAAAWQSRLFSGVLVHRQFLRANGRCHVLCVAGRVMRRCGGP